MNLDFYTLRNGLRELSGKTEHISKEAYRLLLSCCNKYTEYLTHRHRKKEKDLFTGRMYTTFDRQDFETRLHFLIPSFEENLFYISPDSRGYIDHFEPFAIIDYIEYIAQNMKDVEATNISLQSLHYNCLDSCEVFSDFQTKINECFSDTGLLYTLSNEKRVERILDDSVLATTNMEEVLSIQEEETQKLLQEAIERFLSPKQSEHIIAVEKLWDALERLKTYYGKNKSQSANQIVKDMSGNVQAFFDMFNDEFTLLTKIGNDFRIRHHETYKIDIEDSRHYDYLFNRCLSLIALAVKYLK